MTFRQFRRTFFTYFYRYVLILCGALALFALLWLIVFALDMRSANAKVKYNIGIMQQFRSYPVPNEDTPRVRAIRKELAHSILLSDQKFSDDVSLPASAKQLRKVERTGEPLVLNTRKVKISKLWHQMGARLHQLTQLLIGSIFVMFLSYALRSKQRNESLVDLPWRKPWAIIFFALTLIPGLPFYIASAIRFGSALRNHTFEWNEEGSGSREKVKDDHDGALVKYVELRTNRFRAAQLKRRHAIYHTVEGRKNLLKKLAQQIEAEQRQQATDTAEMRRINRIVEDMEDAMVDESQAQAELEKIRQMHGVTAVMPWRNGIRVVVEVRYEHLGTLYDFGDWAIDLNHNSDIHCERLRSAVRPDWGQNALGGKHPDYILFSPSGFCFRDQKKDIQSYLDRGQFPEAVALMVYSFHYVNPADIVNIPLAFKEVR